MSETTHPSPIEAVIIDDDAISRKVLSYMLRAHPEVSIVAEAPNVNEAISLINKHQPDLIFLDIELPGKSGFSLLDKLPDKTKVVFVTAYDSYAIRAFDVQAFDYLLKPVSPNRLAVTIERLRVNTPSSTISPPSDNIFIQDAGEVHAISRTSIAAIEADSSFTRIHRKDQPALYIRRAISEWEKALPSPPFIRLDRSLIININAIASMKTVNRDKSYLKLGGISHDFTLGRVATARFRKLGLSS